MAPARLPIEYRSGASAPYASRRDGRNSGSGDAMPLSWRSRPLDWTTSAHPVEPDAALTDSSIAGKCSGTAGFAVAEEGMVFEL